MMKKSSMFSLVLTVVLVSSILFSSFQVEGSSAQNKVNFSTDVIYQVVTDRFYDGDVTNNPTGDLFSSDCSNLKKYCGGDWQGIIDRINDGYLTNMGITAIWISQPVENVFSVMNDSAGSTSYHGYWARDFKKTNPYFGDFTDFDQLIQTAHANGIKVIMDFAPNHTSPASYDDPNYMENGVLYDNGSFVAAYSNDPAEIFHHNGGTGFSSLEDGIYRNLFDLADFNHQSNTMDKLLRDSINLWLDKGVDGIRMDAVKHMPFGWQKVFMDSIYQHEQVFTFGEWFLGVNEVDPNNHTFANESGMSLLDFEYGQQLREVLRNGTDDWYGFHNMIQSTSTNYTEVIDQVTFIDNHDMDRFRVENGDTRTSDMALAVLLTSRGVPTIYYGTEQYLTGDGDPNNRKKMNSFDTNTRAYGVIRDLSAIRQSNPALAYGDTEERWMNSDVYIYERQFGNNVVLVAINRGFGDYTITGLNTALPAGTYSDVLGGALSGNSISVDITGAISNFILKARGVAVWQYTKSGSTPNIGHVGPMQGRAGHTITIDGEGFGSTTGTVKFGTANATIQSWSNNQIKVTVPTVASGKYDVSVIHSNGTLSNVYDQFEILGKQVSVRFVVHDAETIVGQNIYVVGNVFELGSWDTNKAKGAMFNQVIFQYPSWYYDVNVPAGTRLEYKFIKKDAQGNVIWEGGSNHVFNTPTDGPATIEVNWQK
jgi:glycosidase